MISSIDPATNGAALLATYNSATTTPSQSGISLGTTNPFLPMTQSTTQGSLNDTINTMIKMLQNFMASLGSMLGGAPDNGTNVGGSGATQNPYDFLRPVDEEPVIIHPPSRQRTGGPTNVGSVPFDNQVPTIIDGEKTPEQTNTQPREIGAALKKSNGEFLWKPQSDKDGKLAILLPKKLTGKVKGVRILSADGTKELGRGKFSGVGNGDREHFRFNKAGGSFPDGAIVVITMEDGSKHHVKIKETSNRTTR